MAQGEFTIELDDEQLQSLDNALRGLTEMEKGAVIKRGLNDGINRLQMAGRGELSRTLSRKPINVISRTRKRIQGGYPPLSSTFTRKIETKKEAAGYAGFKRPGGNVAHLVDKGTVARFTKSGQYRGSVSKGRPMRGSFFWTNTIRQLGRRALEYLITSVKTSVSEIFREK
jgi:hypothetical protein